MKFRLESFGEWSGGEIENEIVEFDNKWNVLEDMFGMSKNELLEYEYYIINENGDYLELIDENDGEYRIFDI